MKRVGIVLVLVLWASGVLAKDVQITLSDSEQQALIAMLDLAVKQGGLAVAGNADYLWKKLQAAQSAPDTPTKDK